LQVQNVCEFSLVLYNTNIKPINDVRLICVCRVGATWCKEHFFITFWCKKGFFTVDVRKCALSSLAACNKRWLKSPEGNSIEVTADLNKSLPRVKKRLAPGIFSS
jgi:hypothetical protein